MGFRDGEMVVEQLNIKYEQAVAVRLEAIASRLEAIKVSLCASQIRSVGGGSLRHTGH